ncbi:hypothetical protein MIFL109517_07510 [Micrococcus flavus]|nr:hypothetical protein GCM10007073_18510 [Micrococcus flavus]
MCAEAVHTYARAMSDDVPALTVDTLLTGPRGRDLCFALLPDPPPTPFGPVPADAAEAMRAAVGRWDPASLTRSTLHAALLTSVDDAMYWQAPWEHEAFLAADGVAEALRPVAEVVVAHPDTAWWTRPCPVRQWSLHPWEHPAVGGRPEGVPAEPIERFLTEAEDDERRFRAWREAGEGPVGGIWWTQPPMRFTRAQIPEAFDLIEDSDAPEEVSAYPVRGHGRVLEIRGPEDWVALCREHPFEVTESRRADWGAVTGRQGRWFLPDWRSVARDWDGLHLTVAGYLSTATRALMLDDPSTGALTDDGGGRACLMAGFDPDATLWLTDVVRPLPAEEEPTQRWEGEPTRRHRAGER